MAAVFASTLSKQIWYDVHQPHLPPLFSLRLYPSSWSQRCRYVAYLSSSETPSAILITTTSSSEAPLTISTSNNISCWLNPSLLQHRPLTSSYSSPICMHLQRMASTSNHYSQSGIMCTSELNFSCIVGTSTRTESTLLGRRRTALLCTLQGRQWILPLPQILHIFQCRLLILTTRLRRHLHHSLSACICSLQPTAGRTLSTAT